MARKHMLSLAVLILMLIISSCVPMPTAVPSIATIAPGDQQATVDAAVITTLTAQSIFNTGTALAQPQTETAVVFMTNTPQASETPAPTETVALPTSTPVVSTQGPTATPINATPMVSVSVGTNCRSGPHRAHDLLGGLVPGRSARVVATNADQSYWVIENPTAPGTCWLWGGYATVTGDISNLPVYANPTQPPLPIITANDTTRCRTAPADGYDVVGTLLDGEWAEIVGRLTTSDWWLVSNPDASGRCWVSSRNATVTGNLNSLPVVAVPQGVPTSTPGPVRTSTPVSGAPSGYSCSITSSSPAFGANFDPRADFDARWTVKNTGSKIWEEGDVRYRFISGTEMFAGEDRYDLTTTVDPGESVQIIVDMVAPNAAGRYSATWGLRVESEYFCNLPVTIDVVP